MAKTHMLVCVVEAVFQLSGRSRAVVAPGIPRSSPVRLRQGSALILKRPELPDIPTVVGGFEMLSPPHPQYIPFMLGPGFAKDMIPIGTEIWAEQEG